MADFNLTQTGQQVQNILDRANKLPTLSGIDNGKTLQVNSSGNIVAVSAGGGGGTGLYKHSITSAGTDFTVISTSSTAFNDGIREGFTEAVYSGQILACSVGNTSNNSTAILHCEGKNAHVYLIYHNGSSLQTIDVYSSSSTDTVTSI